MEGWTFSPCLCVSVVIYLKATLRPRAFAVLFYTSYAFLQFTKTANANRVTNIRNPVLFL